MMSTEQVTKVVIIGAGFAGLRAARRLSGNEEVEVLLVDRNNYHTFTPLLYQVATCGLDPSQVAYPVRSIFRHSPNVHFLMGEVTSIDTDEQSVTIETVGGNVRREAYDILFVAAGSDTNFFGNAQFERHSFGLRTLDDALVLRHHILKLLEKAAWETNPEEREKLMTMVVVGGGPTGLETAGALYELYNNVLQKEYDNLSDFSLRVVLLEAMDRVLGPYPEGLQISAEEQLRDIGVEVITGAFVDEVGENYLKLKDGSEYGTHTIVWATGVTGTPLARMLGVELQKGGRVAVNREMQIIGLKNVYAAGDITYLENPKTGQPYGGIIPVAQQQAGTVAKNIMHQIRNEPLEKFTYFDRGIMATIGRRRAVAWVFNRIPLTGFLAWISWLGLHLLVLLGMRNRLQVVINWVWDYIFYDRSVRLILEDTDDLERHPQLFRQKPARYTEPDVEKTAA